MSAKHICMNCKHRVEEKDMSNDQRNAISIFKNRYSYIVYCRIYETFILANPDRPTQIRSECDSYEPET